MLQGMLGFMSRFESQEKDACVEGLDSFFLKDHVFLKFIKLVGEFETFEDH